MNTLAIVSLAAFVAKVICECPPCQHGPPGGWLPEVDECDPCHRHHHQQIDIREAAVNGYRVDPYNDHLWSDCDCSSSSSCDSSSSSSACDSSSSSSSSCDSSSSSSSCSSESSEDCGCTHTPTPTPTPTPKPTVAPTSTKMPPMVCTTVVLCYPGEPNGECDADQAELASQISSLVSANMAARGITATVANAFAFVTSGAKVISQGTNDAASGSFVGTLTSIGALVIAAAMVLA